MTSSRFDPGSTSVRPQKPWTSSFYGSMNSPSLKTLLRKSRRVYWMPLMMSSTVTGAVDEPVRAPKMIDELVSKITSYSPMSRAKWVASSMALASAARGPSGSGMHLLRVASIEPSWSRTTTPIPTAFCLRRRLHPRWSYTMDNLAGSTVCLHVLYAEAFGGGQACSLQVWVGLYGLYPCWIGVGLHALFCFYCTACTMQWLQWAQVVLFPRVGHKADSTNLEALGKSFKWGLLLYLIINLYFFSIKIYFSCFLRGKITN